MAKSKIDHGGQKPAHSDGYEHRCHAITSPLTLSVQQYQLEPDSLMTAIAELSSTLLLEELSKRIPMPALGVCILESASTSEWMSGEGMAALLSHGVVGVFAGVEACTELGV